MPLLTPRPHDAHMFVTYMRMRHPGVPVTLVSDRWQDCVASEIGARGIRVARKYEYISRLGERVTARMSPSTLRRAQGERLW